MSKPELVTARLIKIATCPSLSGRSELTYHLGCTPEGEVSFSVVANTGGGQFNADPILLSRIETILNGHPEDKPLSSAILQPMFRGKSSNSPAFLLAVLKAEGLVKASGSPEGGYLVQDRQAFRQAMAALMTQDAGTTPDALLPAKTKSRHKSP